MEFKKLIPPREFFGEEFYKFMLRDYEDIRRRRKQLKGKPTEDELFIIEIERAFEAFYKKYL